MKKLIVALLLLAITILPAPSFTQVLGPLDEITFAADGTPFIVFGETTFVNIEAARIHQNTLQLFCTSDTDPTYQRLKLSVQTLVTKTRIKLTENSFAVILVENNPPRAGNITCGLFFTSTGSTTEAENPSLVLWR